MTVRPVSYILPLRMTTTDGDGELAAYLHWLAGEVELIVVDASPQDLFARHALQWQGLAHVPPAPELRQINGKVWGVLTGLRLASHEKVIVADDDVRYDAESLDAVLGLLHGAEVVRPQNYFQPMPWHASWDTSRTLLNRLTGGDWPGTLAFRASYLPFGYAGDCLFENLEMVRTIRAAGGREHVALGVFVRRLPPTTRHFLSQRVRQAYDEWARPRRLALQLSLLPALLVAARRKPSLLAGFAAFSMAAAELGRRRSGATHVFPAAASLMAPLWLFERMVCAWLAVAMRFVRGGVPYHGTILANPATPERELRARLASRIPLAQAEGT